MPVSARAACATRFDLFASVPAVVQGLQGDQWFVGEPLRLSLGSVFIELILIRIYGCHHVYPHNVLFWFLDVRLVT